MYLLSPNDQQNTVIQNTQLQQKIIQKIMSFNHYQFHFPNLFDLNNSHNSHSFKIQQTIEHKFDDRNPNFSIQDRKLHDDQRTEDQVRNDLNLSIEDLLSKISKATADFEQKPKLLSQSQKQQSQHNSFKNSNMSASTQANSNQQQSERMVDTYEPFVQKTKKRESEPQKESFSNNDRFKQTNPQKYNNSNQGFGEVRNEKRNEFTDQKGSDWNAIMKPDRNIESGKEEIKNQLLNEWGKDQQKNHPANPNIDPINLWEQVSSKNRTAYTYKQSQYIPEWERSSSRNQPNAQSIVSSLENQQSIQFGINSFRNQTKFEPINQWTSYTPKNYSINQQLYEWKSSGNISQWQQNSEKKKMKTDTAQEFKISESRNQSNKVTVKNTQQYQPISDFKSAQIIPQWARTSSTKQLQPAQPKNIEPTSFKNIIQGNRLLQSKPQLAKVTQKKQLCNPFEIQLKIQPIKQKQNKIQVPQNPFAQKQQIDCPKREIQALLNPFQNSSFGKYPNQIHKKQQKTRQIAASIIIEENYLPFECKQIPIEHGKKVNSLFDTEKIRQVAASTIIDSPDKMKKNKTGKSPLMEILQPNSPDTIKQEPFKSSKQKITSIKMNSVQKSQFLLQSQTGPKLKIQDFHLGKQIGSGKFGDVYQAIHKSTGALYAIKKIFKSTILQYNMVEQFTRELKIHYSLNYPNIIKLYTHFDDDYHVFLVMEYGEGGMLMDKVKNGEKFASVIVEQMLRAVDYLHNKKIAHRDIKPENIVLMFGDTAKMCDFGWSRVFDSDMKKTFCGTLDYVSPQMKDKGEYSLKIDIWSLGVLTFELLSGFAPFKDEITNWKRKGGNMNKAWNWNILYPPEISSVAESFMRNLLKQNPNQRANIRFCLNHLFVRKYNQMSFDEEEDKRFKEIACILN